MWWQNGVFGGFWPISSNILILYGQFLLYEQYLWFVYKKKNLKFWHQNFWPVLDPFLVKNGHFCTQIRFLAINLVTVHQNFMQVVHRIVVIVGCSGGPSLGVLVRIEIYVMVFFEKIEVYFSGVSSHVHFWTFFIQICPF